MPDDALTMNWWLCWPPCVLTGLAALAFRLLQGSWLAPGAAWAGFWFWAISLPLALAPSFPVSPPAVWVIFGITLFLGLGATAGCKDSNRYGANLVTPPNPILRRRMLFSLMMLSLLAAFLIVREYLQSVGSGFGAYASVEELQGTAHALSVARYNGTTDSANIRLLAAYIYFCSPVGGYAFAQVSSLRHRLLAILPLVSILLVTAITSAKAGFLFCVILWIAAFLVSRQRSQLRVLRITVSGLRRVALLVVALVVIFVSLLVIRHGYSGSSDALTYNLKIYLFGHLSVFSGWWEFASDKGYTLQFGRRLFFGPSALLGLSERVAGAYELVNYKEYNVDSNVFSIYRALIEDFSLSGSFLVALTFGYVSGCAYRVLLSGRSAFSAIWLTFFYAVLLTSHVNNMFGYTTILAAFVAYAFLLLRFRLPSHRPVSSNHRE